MNGQRFKSWGNSRDAGTHIANILNFYLTGMARPHQAPRGNVDACSGGYGQKRLTHFGFNFSVVRLETNNNTHNIKVLGLRF
jgi:hypothetical protein